MGRRNNQEGQIPWLRSSKIIAWTCISFWIHCFSGLISQSKGKKDSTYSSKCTKPSRTYLRISLQRRLILIFYRLSYLSCREQVNTCDKTVPHRACLSSLTSYLKIFRLESSVRQAILICNCSFWTSSTAWSTTFHTVFMKRSSLFLTSFYPFAQIL